MNISALLTCFNVNYSRGGADIVVLSGFASAEACQSRCQTQWDCDFFVFAQSSGICWIRNAGGGKVEENGYITGPKFCNGKQN